jgi:hypothetical protein
MLLHVALFQSAQSQPRIGVSARYWGINLLWISHDSNHHNQQPPVSPGDYSPLVFEDVRQQCIDPTCTVLFDEEA